MDNSEIVKDLIEQTPNAETLEAMEELDNGKGYHFKGSANQLFTKLLEN